MKAVVWFVGQEEIPQNVETYTEFLALDHFARQPGVETIRNVYLRECEKPRRTGDTYTICSRFGVVDFPVKIFSQHPGTFEHVGDVLYHARQRNDTLIVAGSDGSDCVPKALVTAKLIFPQIYVLPQAIHFDYEMPGDRKFISRHAEEISLTDAVSLMRGV